MWSDPWLTPNGRRIAFKEALGGEPSRGRRRTVLDPAAARTPLADTSRFGDQAVWLKDHTIAYTLPTATEAHMSGRSPADGTGRTEIAHPDAHPPAPLG